jgi:anti-sigma regulatory factor (Ser/Thr protein kinase)
MATRINSDGFILTADGKVADPNQKDAAEWKAYIQAEWDKNKATHQGKATPPKDQTIMVVDKGDCLWTIAEDAGTADPRTTAYQLNEQFADNPDLIHPGEIVFVDQSVRYDHSDVRDNTDMFADQTAAHAETAGTDQTQVRADTSTYLSTIPQMSVSPDGTGQHERTLRNILLYPSWDDNSQQGQVGRQIVAEEYLKDFPITATAPGQKDRAYAWNELKVALGVTKKSSDTDGNTEYVDKTKDEIQADLTKNGLKGEDLTKAVDNSVALQKNVNDGYAKVKAA